MKKRRIVVTLELETDEWTVRDMRYKDMWAYPGDEIRGWPGVKLIQVQANLVRPAKSKKRR